MAAIVCSSAPRTVVGVRRRGRHKVALIISRVLTLFGSIGECGDGGGLVRSLLATCDKRPLGVVHGSRSHPILVGGPYVGIVNSMRAGVLRRIFHTRFLTGKLLSHFLFICPGGEGVSK